MIGRAALPPNVPDHVPLNGPEDGWAEGLIGEDEPPPEANPTTVIKIQPDVSLLLPGNDEARTRTEARSHAVDLSDRSPESTPEWFRRTGSRRR